MISVLHLCTSTSYVHTPGWSYTNIEYKPVWSIDTETKHNLEFQNIRVYNMKLQIYRQNELIFKEH